MDALQYAIVAEIARRNGKVETAKHFGMKCDKEIRRQIAENRAWRNNIERRW